jgi:hypothetical protein
MKNPIQLTKAIVLVGDSLSRWPRRRGFLLIPLALGLAALAISPTSGCDEICDGLPETNCGFGHDVQLPGKWQGIGLRFQDTGQHSDGQFKHSRRPLAMANTDEDSNYNTIVGDML